MKKLKMILDNEIYYRNNSCELSEEKPDPLMVARKYKDETISLICALFAYGNAKQIVKFLNSLDFSIIDSSEAKIKKALSKHYYRFQKPNDVINIFIALKRLKKVDTIENIVFKGYKKENNLIDGANSLIDAIRDVGPVSNTKGYDFLVGKTNSSSPYKRYMMYFRWMTRFDSLDMGLWSKIDAANLILPLDTHTFNVCRKLGLLSRKTYDLKAALEATKNLKKFDTFDPVKYDFALYRIGQEKNLDEIIKKIT
ncbi:MAG: TIGR02757 family protein [Sulfurovaceae bacterium]|nr:TIGR02757 family protein [Sulfurovaceae bacterium]MDD5548657.1 TIGR02757 family protein [Sulfurovaceae bacterium]